MIHYGGMNHTSSSERVSTPRSGAGIQGHFGSEIIYFSSFKKKNIYLFTRIRERDFIVFVTKHASNHQALLRLLRAVRLSASFTNVSATGSYSKQSNSLT